MTEFQFLQSKIYMQSMRKIIIVKNVKTNQSLALKHELTETQEEEFVSISPLYNNRGKSV